MMSLGYVGNGGSSSSSSNLSPLAPPFTVDRSNSKPNSNPLSHFTEPTPYALQNWPYPHSSPSRPDFVVDSVRTSSMPAVETDYAFLGSESVNPQPTRWSPSNPGLKVAGSDWSALNPESVNPQSTHHWSPMSPPGVKSSSEWSTPNPNPVGVTDSFSYLSEAKPYYPPYVGSEDVPLVALNEPSYDMSPTSGLRPLIDGSSTVDYTQTLSGLEYAPQWEGIWSGGLSEANRGKRMEADDSFFSLEADMAGSLVYKNYMKPAESLNKGQEDSALSSGNYTDFIGTGHSVAGKLDGKSLPMKNHSYTPVDFSNAPSSRAYPTFPEVRFQGPTVEPLKEPWANQKPYTIYEKRFQMFDAGKTDITLPAKSSPGVVIKPPAVGTTVMGPGKGSSKKEGSSQRNDQHPFLNPNAIKEEVLRLNNVLGKSDLDHGSKARSVFQLPDINIPDVESIETVKSEDSPCWKGAGPASLFSPFATIDDATLQLPAKKLQTSDGMIFQEKLMSHTGSSSPKVSSGESCEKTMRNENVCVDNGSVVSPKKNAAAKPSSSKGYGSLGKSNSDSDSNTSHTQVPIIKEDASQVGTLEDVVHTFNSVPVSDQEDASMPATAATMNVQILVKSMHDLSALLLFHCSNDANALKEKDHLALDHVISNLDACLSRKIVHTSNQDSVLPQLGTSNEGACAGMSQATTEAAASSYGRVNSAPDGKGNRYLTGKKFENLKGLLSLRDDGDVSKEHNMVQAIKKILDENLEKEEFQSQTPMYKNLWLEAEAELCSVSYRARFERMKREMEKCKSMKGKDVSENTVALEKLSSPKVSPDPNATQKLTPEVNVGAIPSTSIQDSPVSSSNSRVDNVETSVMARFNILKRRGEPIAVSHEEQQETVMARFNILKRRDEPIAVSGEEQQETKSFDVAVGPRPRHQNVTDDPAAMQSRGAGASRTQNQVVAGWYNSPYSSSDWEHVLKDEFAWRTDGVEP